MIVSLANVKPLPRGDGIAFTAARLDEGPDVGGPWTTIEPAIVLNPVDTDPAHPQERLLTSTSATLEHGWYRVTFLDDQGGEQELDAIPGDDLAAGLLASIDDVDRYLSTTGRLSSGADLDRELLWQMLEAASDRMRRARPERTLIASPSSPSAPGVARGPFTVGQTGRVQVPDLRVVETMTLDGTELAPVDYELIERIAGDPALWVRLRYPALTFASTELTIVGHWGPLRVFPSVREACIQWVGRVFHQRAARFADNAQMGPDGGVLGYFRNLPPDVKAVLDDLQIPGL